MVELRLSQEIVTLAQKGKVTISTEICPWRQRGERDDFIVKYALCSSEKRGLLAAVYLSGKA